MLKIRKDCLGLFFLYYREVEVQFEYNMNQRGQFGAVGQFEEI